MITSYPFLMLLLSFALGIFCNFFRFNFKHESVNKTIIIVSSFALIHLHSMFFPIFDLENAATFLILVTAYCFGTKGGVFAILFSLIYVYFISGHLNIGTVVFYLIVAVLTGYFSEKQILKRKEDERWFEDLLRQAKQLHIYREVNLTMQQTLQLKRLLQVILISVTAGHGLGFNRAMIFLTVEGKKLRGIMGIGPMSPNDGYGIWDRLALNNFKLMDIIKLNYNTQETDPELNAILKSLTIELDQHNILERALTNEVPYHVKSIDKTDKAQLIFSNYFQMTEFAVIPLINQGNQIGVLVVDNIVNKKPITSEEIDSAIPLASQAAIAIEHANLYEKVKDMAMRDGLTGLLNQRALDSMLDQLFTSAKLIKEPLAVIIFDIDFFKHYNDTNGHLLGNEVLIKLAATIESTIREKDLAFRFGGEEFLILLQNTTIDKAYYIAERIRTNIEKTEFPNAINQPLGAITVSLGIAYSEHSEIETKDDLIKSADEALYAAKRSGKNKVMVYKEPKYD